MPGLIVNTEKTYPTLSRAVSRAGYDARMADERTRYVVRVTDGWRVQRVTPWTRALCYRVDAVGDEDSVTQVSK